MLHSVVYFSQVESLFVSVVFLGLRCSRLCYQVGSVVDCIVDYVVDYVVNRDCIASVGDKTSDLASKLRSRWKS